MGNGVLVTEISPKNIPRNYNSSSFYFELHGGTTKSRPSDSKACPLVDIPPYSQISLIIYMKQFSASQTHPTWELSVPERNEKET